MRTRRAMTQARHERELLQSRTLLGLELIQPRSWVTPCRNGENKLRSK